MANETFTAAAFVRGLKLDRVPPAAAARAKALTLDFLGSAVRARGEAESTPAILATLQALGLDSAGPATVMGDARGYAAPVAALLNGALGHSLDFDDTHAASSLHPSAPVVPAALAAGELVGANGRTVLEAIIAGYEICCRLGLALDPTAHYARGFHPTATAGTFGAAAAAGKVLGLDAAQMVSAFGVAGSQAAGSLQFLENGAWTKRWQVGAAAMNGLIAASLAQNGFRGAEQAIEGRQGFLAGYSDGAVVARATDGLGDDWETLRVAVKPYPCCRYAHAALDGLIALRREHGFGVEDLRSVEIGLHRNGVVLVGTPEAAKRRPANVVEGQFSMAFAAAVALDQGRFGWDDYVRLGEPGLQAICDLVEVRQNDAVEAASPHPFGARVRVVTAGGTYERAIPDPSGEPESFPDEDAQRAKFMTLAAPALGERAALLAGAILDLDSFGDVRAALRFARLQTGAKEADVEPGAPA
ncbi:MAG: MmgE/PrpD family protein [Caulobacteraceae bacterium]